jgi:pantoate--beta-alanine ligase
VGKGTIFYKDYLSCVDFWPQSAHMILYKKVTDLHNHLDLQRKEGKKTGFIPTMGALHKGHISLIRQAKNDNDLVISSIFVNPTQFNDPADFDKYPVTIDKDIDMLEAAGCDILFLPSVKEIYPDGIKAVKHYDLGYIETILEGKYRPGHFQGVCAVVHRLLNIVKPVQLYLGQKDYQQCMVIRKLVELTDMENDVHITISPTLREDDGLAMSSRNMRLDAASRKKAPLIHKALQQIKQTIQSGSLDAVKNQATTFLNENGFKVDYVEIADAGNLQPVHEWNGKQKLVTLTAAFLNEVRLIDNLLLN